MTPSLFARRVLAQGIRGHSEVDGIQMHVRVVASGPTGETDDAARREQEQGHDSLVSCFLRVEREMDVGSGIPRGFRVLFTPVFLPFQGSPLFA